MRNALFATHHRSGPTRLFVILAMAAGLIVGLLTMHAAGGHSAPPLPGITSTHSAAHADATTSAATSHPDAGVGAAAPCDGDCPADEHGLAATACVLALMVLMLFLAPSRSALTSLLAALQATPRAGLPQTAAPKRPPSLAFLSISRR